MKSARLAYLFKRFTEQSCTEAERHEFLEMVRSGRHSDELNDLLQDVWQGTGTEVLPADRSEKILKAILGEQQPMPMQRSSRVWWAAAAAVVLIATAVFYWYPRAEVQALAQRRNAQQIKHDRKYLILPDGSTVILNADSELEVPTSFDNMSIRQVSLKGEGYFDVVENPDKPFVVVTGKLKTTVLGTAFNVRAYPGQPMITVTVTRGKVKVSDNTKVIGIITPNQQITFNETSSQSEQRAVNSVEYVAWRERDIFFDDLTMQDAIKELEQRFDTNIELGTDALGACRFTATFVSGETLEQILTVICEFNGASFQKTNDGKVRITGTGCR